jgi:hypothetical protein
MSRIEPFDTIPVVLHFDPTHAPQFSATPDHARVPIGSHQVKFMLQSPAIYDAKIESIVFKKDSPGSFILQLANEWVLADDNVNNTRKLIAYPYTTTISFLLNGVRTSAMFDPEVENEPRGNPEPPRRQREA